MSKKLLITLIMTVNLTFVSAVFAQEPTEEVGEIIPEAEVVTENPTNPNLEQQPPTTNFQNFSQSISRVSGPQKASTSNTACVKVGDAKEEDKAAACQSSQTDSGFVGPVIPQYCGEDPAGQPVMCIKPAYVFYCQGDPAWGGTCSMTSAGCGPATMAMVFSSYGDTITPLEMDRDIFQQRGWRVCGDNPSLMETAIQTLLPENGYEIRALGAPLNLNRAQEYLNAGYLIIGSTSGHIFVIDGVDPASQTLRLRDPGRCENKDGVIRPASAPWAGQPLTYSYAVKKVVN